MHAASRQLGHSALALVSLAMVVINAAAKADVSWVPLNGPQGGSLYALAQDPLTGDLFAATGYQHGYNKNAGSIFKSTDNGDHWTYVSADFFTSANAINTRVRGIAVNSSGHVFAGMEGAGVWRSTNGGTNWSPINAGLADLKVRGIAISPVNELYAATETAGVYVWSGTSWSASNSNLTNLNTRCVAFGPGYELTGTNGGGIFKRPTGGNWSPASNGLTNSFVMAIYTSPGGARLLACTNFGLFESNDQAVSWHEIGPFSNAAVWAALETPAGTLVGAGMSIYLSDLSGTQWSTATSGYDANACRALLRDNAGRLYAGSFDNGLYRSTDGAQSWSQVNDGLYGRTVTRLVVTSKGYIVAGTNQQGMYRSDVIGSPWTGPILPTRNMFALAESPWGDLFAGNYTILPGGVPDGHAWRSSDDGVNWTPLDNGPAVAMFSGFVFPAPQQIICSTAWGMNSVRTSTNNGDNWSLLSPGPGNEAYCLTRNTQGDLFIGSEGHGVLRYSAASQTWTNLGLATLSQQFSIAINSQGHVFVGNDGNVKGVYKSTANGDALSPLNSFPSNYGYTICCLPNDDLYVGTLEKGIQHSNNGGTSWTTVNSGIPVSSCQILTLGPDGHLYAGVAGFGVYRSAQPVVSQLPGDIEGDGDVDSTDVDLFVNVLIGTETLPIRVLRSDLNADDVANGSDLEFMTMAFLDS